MIFHHITHLPQPIPSPHTVTNQVYFYVESHSIDSITSLKVIVTPCPNTLLEYQEFRVVEGIGKILTLPYNVRQLVFKFLTYSLYQYTYSFSYYTKTYE